jgi:hypothetical protein
LTLRVETCNHPLVWHLKTHSANAALEPQDKAILDFALEPMLDCALAPCAAYLLNFVGQYPATLRRTLFAADLKPALAIAGVLPCAGVFAVAQKLCPLQLLMPEHGT